MVLLRKLMVDLPRTVRDDALDFVSLQRFQRWLRHLPAGQPLWLFDIDNTLAVTWPSLVPPVAPEPQRLSQLPVHAGARALLAEAGHAGAALAFLTARAHRSHAVTRAWLAAQLGVPASQPLFLVSRAARKEAFFFRAVATKRQVTVVDDLSYGHETGEVQMHQPLITALAQLPVRHIDYAALSSRNGDAFYAPPKVRDHVQKQR